MDWRSDANVRRQSSCRSSGDIGSWWRSSSRRRTTTGARLGHYRDAPYQQMDDDEAGGGGAPAEGRRRRRRGWFGAWKRLLRSGKWRLFEPTKVSARDCPRYDPEAYAQNFDDGGSFRALEPENLSRSFSAQFANPSGFLQRTRT